MVSKTRKKAIDRKFMRERELTNPEGVGLDLRVGKVYQLKGKGFLGVEKRKTPVEEKIGDVKTDKNKIITLSPSDYLSVKTMERINCPAEKIFIEKIGQDVYLMPKIYPRSNLQRSGVLLLATKTDPGYYGELTFNIKILSSYQEIIQI